MKQYKTKCECGSCVGEITLSRPKITRRVMILVNRSPVEFGLYEIRHIRDWLTAAIDENKSEKSVKSVAKRK